MNEGLERFAGATNLKFKKFTYQEEINAELPVFELKEPSIEEWNKKARIQNTKAFMKILKR